MINDKKNEGILGNRDEKIADKTIREKVVKEDLAVGKREVEGGGVRVTTRVTEKPVTEQVTLRDESVSVERNPVDRPATSADFIDEGPRVMELREKSEEAVVEKKARVVEEVVVRKDVEQRTETINETVRNKEVDVERIPGDLAPSTKFPTLEPAFRSSFESSYGKDTSFDAYRPAYRYGASLGEDQRYAGKDWNAVEPVAKRDWESAEPGSWERFKKAVREAWERVINPDPTPYPT